MMTIITYILMTIITIIIYDYYYVLMAIMMNDLT